MTDAVAANGSIVLDNLAQDAGLLSSCGTATDVANSDQRGSKPNGTTPLVDDAISV